MRRQYIEQRRRGRDPTEYSALRLDHREPDLVKFREVRGTAIRQHDAAEATIIGLAHGGVDADLGCNAADEQRLMPRLRSISSRSVWQNAPLPGLSITGSPVIG